MKTIRSRCLILAGACMGLLAGGLFPAAPALAANEPVITGIRVVSWEGGPFVGSPEFLVDGSGLTRYDPTALHAPADETNSVRCALPGCGLSNGDTTIRGVIDLLGAYKQVQGVSWGGVERSDGIVAGARSVTFKTSMDGVNFENVPGATVELPLGEPGSFTAARSVSISTPARYVMIESRGFYGDYWGLSEVMFTGVPLAVPEPASFGLMGVGLALLGAWRRRRAAGRAIANASQRLA